MLNNVYQLLENAANKSPNSIAICVPHKKITGQYNYQQTTFGDLLKYTDQLAVKFSKLGIKKNSRVLFFVKPSLDFPAITFALFKIGAVPVMIDPGMGLKNLLECVEQVDAEFMIGIPAAHLVKKFNAKYFKSVKLAISTGLLGDVNLKRVKTDGDSVGVELISNDDHAAILFTSGGTGVPKGVIYTHDIFISQTKILKDIFSLNENDVDCPAFPLFALFTLGMGMKVVFPDMNPSKPSKANPKNLYKHLIDQKITFAAGSPAIWSKLAQYCLDNDLKLSKLKYMVMFGAPIAHDILVNFSKILIVGDTYTPYGATECLPIALVNGKNRINQYDQLTFEGAGICVGKPVDGYTVKIIKSVETEINKENLEFLSNGEIGEIVVSGPTVTKEYFNRPDKTKLAKFIFEDKFFHRMGDLGYIDEKGNIWFCGRLDHQVETEFGIFYSIPIESFYNKHHLVKRSALVKVKIKGHERPAIVVECKKEFYSLKFGFEKMKRELLLISDENAKTKEIKHFFLHPSFPVDVRHNIKIDRRKLWAWAQDEVRKMK